MISCDQPGQDSQKNEKEDGPDEDGVAFEEFDILVVIALYVHEELSCSDFDFQRPRVGSKKRYATGSSIIFLRPLLSIFFLQYNLVKSNGLLRNNLL